MKNTQYIFGSITVLIIILLVALFGYLSNQQNINKNRIDNLYTKINSDKENTNEINLALENQNTQLEELLNYIYNNNSENNIKENNVKTTKDLPESSSKKANDSKQKNEQQNQTNINKEVIQKTEPITKENICIQKNNFLKLKPDPKNNFPDPKLNVECNEEYLIINSNGIPTFEFISITPNELKEQNHNWQIPLFPKLTNQSIEIPLLGPIAIAIDGLPFYGPNEGPPQGYGDPFLDQILDSCNGHTAPQGDYHYHSTPDCIIKNNPNIHIIGYSMDGFEILAPNINIKSSWQKSSNARPAWEAHEFIEGSGDLDKCNGRIDKDGKYRYYSTFTFPYIIGCYSGIIDSQVQQNHGQGNMRPGGQNRRPNRND